MEERVLSVLNDVAEQGLPLETLEAVLHQMELSEREITGDGFPYGLRLLLEALTPAIHGADPVPTLDSGPQLDTLREDIKNPDFIKHLTRRWLLDNAHRVRLVMVPDHSLAAAQDQGEKQRLANLAASLNAAERERVIRQTQALQQRQTQPDDPELLPKVGLADVDADLKIPLGTARPVNGLPATWYARGTNGMVYEQVIVDLPSLDEELLDVLPLYAACLSEVGSGGRDYLTTQAAQAAVTGGLNARCLMRADVNDVQRSHAVLVLAGKALARHQAALADLLGATLFTARFDEAARLRELIGQLLAQREESVTQHGHALALVIASAGLSPTAALSNRWEGLEGVKRLRALDEALRRQDALADFSACLETLHGLLHTAPRQLLIVSEEELQDGVADSLARCWAPYPSPVATAKLELPPVEQRIRQAWSTSTQVSFCAQAYPTVAQNHPDAPALQVLGEFLRNGYLHRAVREQGGAYGVGAGYHPDSGAFRLYSYRDPRLSETLDDFARAIDWLLSTEHSPRLLEEAILGVIAAIDRPGSPAGEAIGAFFGDLFGRDADQRRDYRRKILQVSLADLKRVTATYLQPERASSAVISAAERIRSLKGWETLAI